MRFRELLREYPYTSVLDGDEKTIEDIRRIKKIVSRYDSYEDMIKAINDYIEEGNSVDPEVFFLFHNVYTLKKPEKFYNYFRTNLFSKDYYAGGKGEEIDEILESILKYSY